MKRLSVVLFVFLLGYANAQDWESFTDSIPTLSSPRSTDLNGDGVMDVVIGGGTDGVFSNNGIMAYNGVDGSLLWKRPSRDEVFGSAIFQDITSDGINDVIIVGRSAQLLAIDGANGVLLWDYINNPIDTGLYNFYNPQFIHDVDGDTYADILVSYGGDHSAPYWESNRPPGYLMVVSALTGNVLVQAVVPDSAETYCSPIIADIQNTGDNWVLYGTGGENFGGHFYAVLLEDLLLGDLSSSIVLASDLNKGFIAPAAIHKNSFDTYDIIIQSFDGLVIKIDGQTFVPIWTYQKQGTESSAEPVIGNFTGDLTPDILLVLFKGIAPSYNDYYQVMLDGNDGTVSFIDSLGVIDYASGNAVDLNNDGRDEGIYSITYYEGGCFKSRIESIDFTTNTITTLDQTRTGVTIASTPYINDLDNDGLLDLVYSVKKDSINPMGWGGISVYRHELSSIIPNAGIAWGSYLGTNMNGVYNAELIDCGNGSVIASINTSNPSCNGFSDGAISLSVVGSLSSSTYLWSNQSNSSSIQNLEAGSYWVQVVDSLGCYELRTINLYDPLIISFGGIVSPTCIGDSNGMATLSSSGCPCMFNGCTFLWDNGVTTKYNTSLTEGWHSVSITHLNGCVVVDSVFIPSSSYSCFGCTDPSACNYAAAATNDDGSCEFTSCATCNGDPITGLFVTDIIDDRVNANFDNMNTYDGNGNQVCRVDQIRIRYREVGTNSWSQKNIGSPTGYNATTGICNSTQRTDKPIRNLTLGTTYEWEVKTWYCDAGATGWVAGPNFSTAGECPNVGNLTAVGTNPNKATFNWNDSNGSYEFVRIKIRVDSISSPVLSDWVNVGGNGVTYSTFTKDKNGLVAGETYRGQARTWCDPNGGAYNSLGWTPLVTWTQPIASRIEGGNSIDNLDVYPNPSRNIFNISFTSDTQQNLKVRMLNVVGEILIDEDLQQFIGEYTKQIDLTNNAKGIYFLEIETNDGVINKKLILQ